MPKSPKPEKMKVTFREAPEAEKIGRELACEHFSHLCDLNVRVEYLFRSDTQKRNGKIKLASCQKVSSLAAFLGREERNKKGEFVPLQPFFAIIVSEPQWGLLSDHQKRALVHHELCHAQAEIGKDGKVKLSIRPHDLEEFAATVQMFGLWKPDVEAFARVTAQLNLDLVPDTAVVSKRERTGAAA